MTRIVRFKMIPSERDEQIMFVAWLAANGYRCSASANGGSHNLLEALNLKKKGFSKGFHYVEARLPSGKYHGFFVEMKRQKGGIITPEQTEWLAYLRSKGYYAEIAKGFDEAKKLFLEYLAHSNDAA